MKMFYKKGKDKNGGKDKDEVTLLKVFDAIFSGKVSEINQMAQQVLETIIMQKPEFKRIIAQIEQFFNDVDTLKNNGFSSKETYELKQKYEPLYNALHKQERLVGYQRINQFFRIYTNIDYERSRIKSPIREREKQRVAYLLDHIDGKSLDEAQKDAVVCEEENCLVIAGAGSGKTLTIAGKVAYLVKEKGIKPEHILLITFTTKAANEMEERIVKKLGIPVKVKTFHALGSEIITEVEQKKPSVQEQNKYILDQYFKEGIFHEPSALQTLVNFFAQYLYCPPHVEDHDSLGEYYSSLKSLNLKTLKDMTQEEEINKVTFQGEEVKSLQELMIANFLYINGIKYEYEKSYEHEVADSEHRQYRPDFYLPEAGLYIEHFGIDRQGKANWLPPIENKKYQDGIVWKRQLHTQMGTRLYETYSFQFEEGNIFEILESDLKKLGVVFKPLPPEQVYEKLLRKENRHFKELKKLVWTFLNLFKSHNYDISKLQELQNQVKREENLFMRYRMLSFLNTFKGVFIYYQNSLERTRTIDFNDMINQATDYIKQDRANLLYEYIIIDEYQDIAYARGAMVQAIKQKTNAKLMAVGDDWQSIYRFAGSDMSLFTNFEKLFGITERIYIEDTYRNSQELIDIAGSFITRNPLQLQKHLSAKKHLSNPVYIIGYNHDIQKALLYTLGKVKAKEVMILGRNNFDVQVLQGSTHFHVNTIGQDICIKCKDYPELNIKFITVHKSKGLESEEVIIINCKNDLIGFPNQLADDPILDLVMTQCDYYRHGEERRLFYVALTRTKNYCYLLVPENNASCFIHELIEHNKIPFEHVEEDEIKNEKVTCPRCRSGLLVKRKANNKSFLGCSNYPFCEYTVKNIDILSHAVKCDVCGGYMVKRKGRRGMFYGCTNYPECNNTNVYSGYN